MPFGPPAHDNDKESIWDISIVPTKQEESCRPCLKSSSLGADAKHHLSGVARMVDKRFRSARQARILAPVSACSPQIQNSCAGACMSHTSISDFSRRYVYIQHLKLRILAPVHTYSTPQTQSSRNGACVSNTSEPQGACAFTGCRG